MTQEMNGSKDNANPFGLEKKNIHQVPKGFFDDLEIGIRDRIATSTTVKLVRFERWFELSAAAAILLIVFFTGSKVFPNRADMSDANTVNTLYSVPNGTGNDYYPIF